MIEQARRKGLSQVPVDVGAQQIAATYAKALLGAAENEGKTSEVVAELDSLVSSVLDAFPKFEAVMSSALVSPEDKVNLIDRVFGQRVSPLMVKFLKVVARHDRLELLRAIHVEIHKGYDDLRGRVPVHLLTATAVSGELAKELVKTLRGMVGGEPEIEAEVDPGLIAGLVVRVGDTVYDGSVARQLRQVHEQMINRSIHEIQSRRDRFRPSGGN